MWSSELAAVAQEHAEQCMFRHNGYRTSEQSTFRYVGENMYVAKLGVFPDNFTAFVERWFDERESFLYHLNGCGWTSVCTHYTQVRFEHV